MKNISQILALGFRTLIFVLVFSSIVLQPVVKSMSVIDPQAFSWLALDSEKDSSEKESQEVEDSKEKKVQLRLTLLDVGSIVFFQTASNYSLSYFKNDVTIDLHDPPPEVI
jgi:hypothetical protein|tara:strand:+ start:132 stop:464 length:333 start_codon:yes stop_codon:yes gene_type:complete